MNGPIVTILAEEDGPAMRRRRKEPPPPRRPRLNEHRLAKFADRLFNERLPDERLQDRELRDLAERDWRSFLGARFKLTDAERTSLESLPDEVVEQIGSAVRTAVERGGALELTLPQGKKGGELTIVGPKPGARTKKRTMRLAGPAGTGGFKIPIVKCTFDADCRNWRCRPG